MGSFSIWHWLIVLLIVVKDGMKDGASSDDTAAPNAPAGQVTNTSATADKTTIDVEAKQKS